ncbi:MAG: peptide deformylase [Actinobacteria bacterium]|nr:MAG: peptide deformylase [Actinomycetota bacterium]
MRTKSRVRGSIASRASAGKFRLCRSIRSFTAAKFQLFASPRQAVANSAGSSSVSASILHASSSRRSCCSTASSIARSLRIQAVGPPSARTPESGSGRKFRRRCRSGFPRTGLDSRSASSCSRSRRSCGVSGLVAPWFIVSRSVLGSTSARVQSRPMSEIEGQIKEEELDAEQQARRRMALAQIRQYPDAALKMAARPVEEFDDDLRQLVDRMKQLMVDANGIGLAATQVGVLQRLFVFQVSEGETVALANPEIVDRGEVATVEDEGCLSIQGVLLPVERAAKIAIAGQDEHGAEVRYELEEPYSRVAQHETDHLDGILILDRTTPEARREALASLRPRIVIG